MWRFTAVLGLGAALAGCGGSDLGAFGPTGASTASSGAGGASSSSATATAESSSEATTTNSTSSSVGGGSASSTASSSSATGGGGEASSSSSVVTSSSGSGGSVVCATHFVISEIQTRGQWGALDEFVEVLNPTDATLSLDVTITNSSPNVLFAGKLTLAPHSKRLFCSLTAADHHECTVDPQAATYDWSGLPQKDIDDCDTITLSAFGQPLDLVCFCNKQTNWSQCEGGQGANAINNHDDKDDTNYSGSIARGPSDPNNCVDTDNNAADFYQQTPSTPGI